MNAGETQGIVALDGQKFQLAWIDGESEVMQLSSTMVDVFARPLGIEIGDLLDVQTSAPTMDIAARTMSMQVKVTNRSARIMQLPLTVVLSRMGSIFEGVRVVNSDNHLPGVGAAWQLAANVENKTALGPNEASAPIVLKFVFENVPKEKLPDVGFGAPLDIEFHVFENQK